MSDLTEQELREKIQKVEEDMKTLNQEKGREALLSYLEYLRDELKMLKDGTAR
jgi:ribosome-interacting GTPase 1